MQCVSARHFVFSGFEFVLLSEDAYSGGLFVFLGFCFIYLEVTCVVWFRQWFCVSDCIT